MYNFGIISEGFTDQITIDNILCGYFQEQDLDITYLYPDFDVTTKKQIGGGWRDLSNHLQIKGFRNAVASFDFVIIQLDTDFLRIKKDAEEFGLYESYNELTTEKLVTNIIAKLVSKINAKESGFYEKFKNKIIFAISVDSIVWYSPKTRPPIKIEEMTKNGEKSSWQRANHIPFNSKQK